MAGFLQQGAAKGFLLSNCHAAPRRPRIVAFVVVVLAWIQGNSLSPKLSNASELVVGATGTLAVNRRANSLRRSRPNDLSRDLGSSQQPNFNRSKQACPGGGGCGDSCRCCHRAFRRAVSRPSRRAGPGRRHPCGLVPPLMPASERLPALAGFAVGMGMKASRSASALPMTAFVALVAGALPLAFSMATFAGQSQGKPVPVAMWVASPWTGDIGQTPASSWVTD